MSICHFLESALFCRRLNAATGLRGESKPAVNSAVQPNEVVSAQRESSEFPDHRRGFSAGARTLRRLRAVEVTRVELSGNTRSFVMPYRRRCIDKRRRSALGEVGRGEVSVELQGPVGNIREVAEFRDRDD